MSMIVCSGCRGFIEPDYICEECFTPQDTGPCFDDLPKMEARP